MFQPYLLILITVIMEINTEKVYQIPEEVKIGYSIDHTSRSGQRALRIFNTRDKGANLFTFDASSQKLVVVARIDREKLCPKPPNSQNDRNQAYLTRYESSLCEIRLKLILEKSTTRDKITIQIEDINDNAPVWPLSSGVLELSFVENEKIGSRRSLQEAQDPDMGVNGRVNYRLESDARSYFRLITENGLYLENTQMLDREEREFYTLKLIAQDNGNSVRTSEIELSIRVIDVNDNSPQFTNSLFRLDRSIKENAVIGEVILTLTASDLDKGINGQLVYSMSPSTPREARRLFEVTTDGRVRIKNRLDYDRGHVHFQFKVMVHDRALPPHRLSSEATVELDVQDINDEGPEVIFYAVRPPTATGDIKLNTAMVDENADSITDIGQLTVTDPDFKGTDKVHCRTLRARSHDADPILILATDDMREFRVVTNRKFDHETEPVIVSQVECSDSASHSCRLNITILVQDVNDNKPDCVKPVYHLKVAENRPSHTKVTPSLGIVDRDGGRLTLRVQSPDDQYFQIDSARQQLTTKVKFDREVIALYHISVIAIDDSAGVRHTTTCKVVVNIADVNDNGVVLSSPVYTFHIEENNRMGAKIGIIGASDLDNQTIRYYLLDYQQKQQFSIGKYTGEITAKVSLDREKADNHTVLVKATDGKHASTATASIFVNDVNDMSPIFKSPNSLNKVIQINTRQKPGYFIKKIVAVDGDSGNNGMVRYSIKSTSFKEDIFNLYPDSGDLYLAVSLHQYRLIDSSVFLDIEACDSGTEKRCTVFSGLEIRWIDTDNRVFNGDNGRNRKPGGSQNHSLRFPGLIDENVLIGIISGLILLMLIILVLFLVFRKKSLASENGSRGIRSDMSRNDKQLQKNLVTYPENMGPPDYNCSTELSGFNRSGIFPATENGMQPASAFIADTSKMKYAESKMSILESCTTESPILNPQQRPFSTSPTNHDFSIRHNIKPQPQVSMATMSHYTPMTTATMGQFKQQNYNTTNPNVNNKNAGYNPTTTTPNNNNNGDTYYSKYIMDRYLKISNTDPSLCESLNNEINKQNAKSSNPKNESSFV